MRLKKIYVDYIIPAVDREIEVDPITGDEIIESVASNNHNIIKQVSGIGEKTAKLILIQLQGQLDNIPHSTTNLDLEIQIEANQAVQALGYPSDQIKKIINEINLSDQYLTWGWHSKEKNATPFYVMKDSWIKQYSYNKSGKILYIGASCKNFFYSFDEGQLPNHKEQHIKNSIEFINHLEKSTFKNFIYRF